MENLVSSGHSESSVWGYTLRKAVAFNTLAEQRKKYALKAEAIAMRMAQADGEGYTKYLKHFED